MIDFEAEANKLRELWNATDESGKPLYSVSAIGKILGLNKNQMTGRRTRLAKKFGGFNPRLNAIHELGKPGPERPVHWAKHTPAPTMVPRIPALMSEEPDPPSADIIPFIMHPPAIVRPAPQAGHGCQWPFGHPREPTFHFCGDRRGIGRPYCDKHAAIAYIRPYRSIA